MSLVEQQIFLNGVLKKQKEFMEKLYKEDRQILKYMFTINL